MVRAFLPAMPGVDGGSVGGKMEGQVKTLPLQNSPSPSMKMGRGLGGGARATSL